MRSRRNFVKTIVLALGSMPLVAYVGRSFADPRRKYPVWEGIQHTCTITCPACSKAVTETMAHENVKRVYHCPHCLTWLAPKHGDHCIYDSYGSVRCPALQLKAKGKNKWTA